MKLQLDVQKDKEGKFVAVLTVYTKDGLPGMFHLPLGDDLTYAMYKGLGIDLPGLDVTLNEQAIKPPAAEGAEGQVVPADAGEVLSQ